jgi:hypothetical protein
MKAVVKLNGRNIKLKQSTIQNTKLLQALESVHGTRKRIRVFYGDKVTGRSWNEEHDVMGTLSNSTGENACLILVANSRSYSGPAILDDCIVRIDIINEKRTIYKHSNFHVSLEQKDSEVFESFPNGALFAKFDNADKARKYVDFMNGNRYSK